jgi:hypothetical protein
MGNIMKPHLLSIYLFIFLLISGCTPAVTSSAPTDSNSVICDPNATDSTCIQPADSTPSPAALSEPTARISPSERVPRITIDELLQKIKNNADILIVDVRVDVAEQYVIAHIKGAVPSSLERITSGQWIPPADRTREIILYCT